jgi:predicted GNAT family acetyltransferase
MADEFAVTNNEAEQRYQIITDGMIAIAEYKLGDGEITFTHTEVPVALGGRGIGGALARAALDDARAKGFSVLPNCPFIRSYIGKHPDYLALVKEPLRAEIVAGAASSGAAS